MKKFSGFKKKRAQELIEFLLIAPFMIVMLGILTEYAYALNVNMTLTQGIKEVTASVYSDIKPNMDSAAINAAVLKNLKTYLDDNNVPDSAENNIKVSYLTAGDTAVFGVWYTYIPAFTLPMKFMPASFPLFASSAVPSAFLNGNTYAGSTNTSSLDSIWSGARGVKSTDAPHAEMLFLVPVSATDAPTLIAPYKLVDWNDNASTYILDAKNGELYTCTTTACTDKNITFRSYAAAYKNIFFVHDSGVGGWGMTLKRTLALVDSNDKTSGNYDNMDIFPSNPSIVSPDIKYTVETSATQVFAHSAGDDISRLK